MASGPPHAAATPPTQLPHGRYPASPAVTWGVVALVVLTGLVLGIAIPTSLSTSDGADGGRVASVVPIDDDSAR